MYLYHLIEILGALGFSGNRQRQKTWVCQLVTVQSCDFGDIVAVAALSNNGVVRAGREWNE